MLGFHSLALPKFRVRGTPLRALPNASARIAKSPFSQPCQASHTVPDLLVVETTLMSAPAALVMRSILDQVFAFVSKLRAWTSQFPPTFWDQATHTIPLPSIDTDGRHTSTSPCVTS